MAFEFKLPDIGEGLTEGEVVKWLVKEGDAVQSDQPMVEVMTDKATVEITSPKTGVIQEIRAAEGQTIPVGAVMVVIAEGKGGAAPAGKGKSEKAKAAEETDEAGDEGDEKGEGDDAEAPAAKGKGESARAAPAKKAAAPARAAKKEEEAPEEEEADDEASAEDESEESEATDESASPERAATTGRAGRRTLAAPATRRLARERGIALDEIPASGPNGRVTRQDVESYAKSRGAAPAKDRAAPGRAAAPAKAKVVSPASSEKDERVPLRGLRAKIAEQMVRSKQFAPHFTYVDECDVTELAALRDKAKPIAEERGIKLTYLPFIMKALVACFRRFPSVNAVVDDAKNEYVVRKDYNIGIATDTQDGLTVPVVKHVDRLSVFEIAEEIQRLTEGARTRKIALEDLKGGTFTITSAGSIGGVLATPILNYPEVGILGVYRFSDKPVVRNGEIVVRKMTNFSLTLDHRIVDGATAARFVNELSRLLETPGLLLLEGR